MTDDFVPVERYGANQTYRVLERDLALFAAAQARAKAAAALARRAKDGDSAYHAVMIANLREAARIGKRLGLYKKRPKGRPRAKRKPKQLDLLP